MVLRQCITHTVGKRIIVCVKYTVVDMFDAYDSDINCDEQYNNDSSSISRRTMRGRQILHYFSPLSRRDSIKS